MSGLYAQRKETGCLWDCMLLASTYYNLLPHIAFVTICTIFDSDTDAILSALARSAAGCDFMSTRSSQPKSVLNCFWPTLTNGTSRTVRYSAEGTVPGSVTNIASVVFAGTTTPKQASATVTVTVRVYFFVPLCCCVT
jgi:hypothetical protein